MYQPKMQKGIKCNGFTLFSAFKAKKSKEKKTKAEGEKKAG